MGFHGVEGFFPGAMPVGRRVRQGARNHLAGELAEDSALRHYLARGGRLLARRWRGQGGEIDLIIELDGCIIFVEVKSAATHASAAWRLGPRQIARIQAAALDYCSTLPTGLATVMRFDMALVDAIGRVEIIENAFWDA